MRATVREYTVKKKVVVVEFTEEEAVEIAGGDTRSVKLAYSVRHAVQASGHVHHGSTHTHAHTCSPAH